MQRTLAALGCTLLISGSAFAQQQGPATDSSGTNHVSASSITEKAKEAVQYIEQKTKETAEKAKEKTQETTQKANSGTDRAAQSDAGTKSMGASGASASSSAGANDPQQMQRQADADYKSAKAQCEPIQQKSQKTLCEKQATAAHASAEVDIEKAKMAAEGNNTSSMGAGKSSQ